MVDFSGDIKFDKDQNIDLLYLLSASSICALDLETNDYVFYKEMDTKSKSNFCVDSVFVQKSTFHFVQQQFDHYQATYHYKVRAFILMDEDIDDGYNSLIKQKSKQNIIKPT